LKKIFLDCNFFLFGTTSLTDLVILVGEEKKGGLIVVELKGNFSQEMLEKAKSQIN